MLAELLARAREERVFSAVAWEVGTADDVLDRGVLGTRWWDGPPVTEASRWDLASVTKPIVGLVVAALAERGELSLDAPLPEFLPSYAGTDKASITVRRLLTHTSGLPGGTPLWRTFPTRAALLEAIRTTPLPAPPGSRVEYSSQGFILLGLIASAASGRPLDRLVADLVTTPAGMRDTTFGPVDDAVATEDCPWRGRVVTGEVHDENAVVLGGICGHAGLFAPLSDVARLGRILAAGASPLLKPQTHAEMIACHTHGLRRGLAWQGLDVPGSPVGTALQPDSYGHTGFTGTSLWVEPARRRYYVLLTNRVHPRRTQDISAIRAAFHDTAARLG
ncbi:esterase [Amycolatopsis sp. NBRC 101858]|uniref:serine hydrolase domain-containing protein n=1 Tax=Amycolatopsis sp. NBRC 101858 TaxID=3032200 RepID=UPI0024A234FE|nr:serine hydrolase domain-containing protein [Amycolatopsis sp. NBRC 101858]GLY43119.1 esterase [Amycolatopsis sp. NBRC 101858]